MSSRVSNSLSLFMALIFHISRAVHVLLGWDFDLSLWKVLCLVIPSAQNIVLAPRMYKRNRVCVCVCVYTHRGSFHTHSPVVALDLVVGTTPVVGTTHSQGGLFNF